MECMNESVDIDFPKMSTLFPDPLIIYNEVVLYQQLSIKHEKLSGVDHSGSVHQIYKKCQLDTHNL